MPESSGFSSLPVTLRNLKASFTAAESSLRVHETIAASGLRGDDGDRQQDNGDEEISAAESRLADLTARWSGNWARGHGRKT